MTRSRARGQDPDSLADRLHSLSIRTLRRVRVEDAKSGLTGPRLSALSVIVFAGPVTLGALAAAEQVRPPTMTKIVRALESEGLVRRKKDSDDARAIRLSATRKGAALLHAGRTRRVRRLAEPLADLQHAERKTLSEALDILSRALDRLS